MMKIDAKIKKCETAKESEIIPVKKTREEWHKEKLDYFTGKETIKGLRVNFTSADVEYLKTKKEKWQTLCQYIQEFKIFKKWANENALGESHVISFQDGDHACFYLEIEEGLHLEIGNWMLGITENHVMKVCEAVLAVVEKVQRKIQDRIDHLETLVTYP